MKKTSILIALLLWLPFGMGSSSAQSGYDLFQKALMLERTDGKLAEAILLYQRVVKESQDEPLAAKAQLQIGICYEKLGQSEARAAYQTVIDKYPRQMETVKAAKERISQLAAVSEPVPDKPKFRKVAIPFKLSWWSPTPSGPVVDFGARLSPDGRTLAFGSEGAIWLIPVPGNVSPDIAGEPRRLTKAMYAMGGGISWSADGSLIAFNAARAEGESQDVYVIPSEGGEPVRLVRREPGFGFAPLGEALSLSPDGKLLAYQSKWDGEGRAGWSRIQTIARGAASPEIVAETKSAQPAFSPDGRMIAYVNYNPMELRVIPASGGESVRVTDTANRAVASPVWSPGGDMLAFLTGTNMTPYDEIWIVPVSEQGKATAAATSFKLPHMNGMPLAGWTSDNKIGFVWGGDTVDRVIYSVPASGGKAAQVTPSGDFYFPRWSPDGERIWFLNGDTPHTLGSVPSSGGTVRNLATTVQEVPPGGGNVISPDGKNVVFAGFGGSGKGVNLWIMPLEGGQPAQLTSPMGQQDRFPCWCDEGRSLLFIRLRFTQESPLGTAGIYRISTKDGEARPVTSVSDEVTYSPIACSPDGKWVAFFSHDSALAESRVAPATSSANCIKIKPLDGGPSQIVTRVHHRSGHEELCWSPDGTMLAYSAERRIWVVPVRGGEPEQVETGLDSSLNFTNLSWSPDGRTFAFVGLRVGEPELWLMEDFLPLVKR